MADPFTPPLMGRAKKKPEIERPGPLLEFWVKLLASGFYSGYFPGMPGTAGSILGALFWMKLGTLPAQPLIKFFALAGLALIAVWLSSLAEQVYSRGDCNIIVIDEIVGVLIALSYLRPGTYENEFRLVLVTFVIFRLLDILKPVPLRQLEQLPRGWGVVMDDVAAGIITLFIMGLPPLHAFWVGWLGLQLKAGG